WATTSSTARTITCPATASTTPTATTGISTSTWSTGRPCTTWAITPTPTSSAGTTTWATASSGEAPARTGTGTTPGRSRWCPPSRPSPRWPRRSSCPTSRGRSRGTGSSARTPSGRPPGSPAATPAAASSTFRSGWKTLPTLAANYLGGVTGYMSVLFLVFIEHHAGELELFTDPGPDETADQYYERQIRATRNFLPSTSMDDALARILAEEVP